MLHVDCCMSEELFQVLCNIENGTDKSMIKSGKMKYQCNKCMEKVHNAYKSSDCKEVSSESTVENTPKIATDSTGETTPKTAKSVNFVELIEENVTNTTSSSQPPPKINRVCSYYVRGTCRHGGSGKTLYGGISCKYLHPKKCAIFCKFGSDSFQGCTRQNCKYLHPFLCKSAINFEECRNPKCTFQHLNGTQRIKNIYEKRPQHYNRGQTFHINHNKSNQRFHFTSRNLYENQGVQQDLPVSYKSWPTKPTGTMETSFEKNSERNTKLHQ